MKITAVKFDLPLELSNPWIFHFLIQVHDTDLMRQCWIQTVVYICVEVERVELQCWSAILKSIYSESATKFEKITHSDLTFAKFCGTLRKPRLPSWKYFIVTLNFMSVLHKYVLLKKNQLFTKCTTDHELRTNPVN